MFPFLSQTCLKLKKHLSSFTTNPDSYIKKFQYLAQSYSLTWHNIYTILSSTILLEERQRVWDTAKIHANEIHCTTPAHPMGMLVVPEKEPHWDYHTNDTTSRDQMVTCLMAGLKRAAQKVANFDKLKKIQQEERKIQPISCPDSQSCYNAIPKLILKHKMGQLFL
jgi:hypothetical protein